MKYQIKSIKQFEMSNGVALTANLYRNNKLIAHLEDKGDGGGLAVRWAEGNVWQNPEESKMIMDFYTFHADKTHWTQEHINADYSDSIELAVEWMIEMQQSKQLVLVGA
jgi:hypothetical protein